MKYFEMMRKWCKKIGIEVFDKWLISLDHVTFELGNLLFHNINNIVNRNDKLYHFALVVLFDANFRACMSIIEFEFHIELIFISQRIKIEVESNVNIIAMITNYASAFQ